MFERTQREGGGWQRGEEVWRGGQTVEDRYLRADASLIAKGEDTMRDQCMSLLRWHVWYW